MDVTNGRPKAGRRGGERAPPRERSSTGRAFTTTLVTVSAQARERKNIGLRELARRLGVSASLISQIETGQVGAFDQHALRDRQRARALGQRDRVRAEPGLSAIGRGVRQRTGSPTGQSGREAQPGRRRQRSRFAGPARHEQDVDQPRVRRQLGTAHRHNPTTTSTFSSSAIRPGASRHPLTR